MRKAFERCLLEEPLDDRVVERRLRHQSRIETHAAGGEQATEGRKSRLCPSGLVTHQGLLRGACPCGCFRLSQTGVPPRDLEKGPGELRELLGRARISSGGQR